MFPVGYSILVIAWQLLAHICDYQELGEDHFLRRTDAEARTSHSIRQLEALGRKVAVEPAAA